MSARQPEPERLEEIRERIRTRLVSYWDTSDAEATRLLDAFAAASRAAVLDEAADVIDPLKGVESADAKKLRRMAAEARAAQTGGATPCSLPNDCDGYEPCDRHERESAHAEGEHELCGDECAEGGERP